MLHASGRAFRLQELVVRIGALLACSLSRVGQVRSRIQCNLHMVPSAHRQGNDAQGVTGTSSRSDTVKHNPICNGEGGAFRGGKSTIPKPASALTCNYRGSTLAKGASASGRITELTLMVVCSQSGLCSRPVCQNCMLRAASSSTDWHDQLQTWPTGKAVHKE